MAAPISRLLVIVAVPLLITAGLVLITPDAGPPSSDAARDRWAPPRGFLSDPPPTPNTAGPETATLGGPDGVGISPGSQLTHRSPFDVDTDMAALRALGVSWVRIDIDWSWIARDPTTWDWAETDATVAAARRHGLAVLGILAYTPPWARPDGTSDKHPPTNIADFSDFAARAAARYRPVGVHHWEIWNEPNLGAFWAPAPDPTAYAHLLAHSVDAIRRVDPEARIISGGLAPARDDPRSELSPETFLRTMYETLPSGRVDAVGIHPYSFPAAPLEQRSWNVFARLPTIADLIAEREGAAVPLWLTEYGVPYEANDPGRQGAMITEALTASANWDWAGPVFIYTLDDALISSGEPPFGLRHGDGHPRPAWDAIHAWLATES